jgi:outer membrane protein assembly factor BamB/tRNA A-37 threonylcarbamoyl transferase component Bud32
MDADFFCPHCGAANISRNVFCSFCSRSLITGPHILLKQRYQVLEKVGQGGFAAVYKVKDLQLLSALRAIKEMDDRQLSPQERQEAIAAFDQEALILARLMHPNLPRIYDHFEEQRRWYLVMDYIEGETLDKILARSPQGKLPVEQVIQYALQLCKVLKYLHTQVPPIIFRDLKPSNIMLTHEDHLYLIDFGIARFFKPEKARDTMPLGSPGYAAPEQYSKQTTPQSDIYSLGATLHHLLSGRDPSDDPFTFPPLQLEPHDSITQAVANLIAQMVEMKREERPASIHEIQQTLSAISLQQTCGIRPTQPIFPPGLPTNKAPSATPFMPINPPGSQMWTFPTGKLVNSSPIVVNGVVYFGSYDGNLYALYTSSGRKKWAFPTRDAVRSSPTVVNDVVYFGSRDRNLYAISTTLGTELWSFSSYNVVHSSPFYFNKVIYVGSDDYNLYAINAMTGQKIWSFRTGDKVLSSPIVANGMVYFGSYDGSLYALDAVSGLKIWSFSTGDGVRASSTVCKGTVYFGSADHKLYALDASSGKLKWSFLTGDKATSSPRVVNGMVYFGSYDHNLYALDAGTGRKIWSFLTGDAVRSSPTVVNGTVYCGSDDHHLYALDATMGRKIWSFQTGNRVQSSPTMANGAVYVGSDDGKLYAIFA